MSALEAAHDTIVPVAVPRHAERTLQDLYERHSDRIFGFCRRRLRSQQEAEDAMQTTFLQAFRALQRGVVPVCEEAWLFKIAENVCLSAHRSNGRRSERELADGGAALDVAPAHESGADALVGLEEALAAIPPRQRDVFVLRELRGLSYREIAAHLGLSVTAVEMLVFRARRNLARVLESGAGLRGRVASLFDIGVLINGLKAVLASGTAAKTASAAVAIVALTALPAGDSPARASGAPQRAVVTSPSDPVTARRTGLPPAGRSASPVERRSDAGAAVAERTSASHRGRPRRPRPERQAGAPESPQAPGGQTAPAAPTAPVAPEPHPTPPPAQAPAPVQVPQPPPVEVPVVPALPQTPELPKLELPQLPVEVPTLPDPLPDPGTIELPTAPTLP